MLLSAQGLSVALNEEPSDDLEDTILDCCLLNVSTEIVRRPINSRSVCNEGGRVLSAESVSFETSFVFRLAIGVL